MKLLGKYKNGNYMVHIFSDGTKVRHTKEEKFLPNFAENCDVKITNCCDIGCAMCHEASCVNGKHGDILNAKFLDTLHPYTELAIGGGDATSHPDLIPFLRKLKEKKVLANLTVNQIHFENKQDLIQQLFDEELINGIGISLVKPTDEFISLVKKFPTAVIHVINGVVSFTDLYKLADNDLKILILGYKQFRKGIDYYHGNEIQVNSKKEWLYDNIDDLIEHFYAVSFDNLALEQLNMKRFLNEEEWERYYMGDDGTMTFYIDMVEKKYALNSTSNERYEMLDDIDQMFRKIAG